MIIYIISTIVVLAILGLLAYDTWNDQGFYNITNLGIGFALFVASFVPIINTLIAVVAIVLMIILFFESYGHKKIIGRK